MELWNLILNNFIGFLLVLCRVTGIFTFNPIFSRSNVPNSVKAGMSVVLAVVMLPLVGTVTQVPDIPNALSFGLIILKELLVGFVFGLFTNLMLTVLIYAGEIIDMQTGLGMAKTMDPTTGINMPIFANIYYYIFILYFFLTNGHLSYIKLFSVSYETIPMGFAITDATVDLARVIVS